MRAAVFLAVLALPLPLIAQQRPQLTFGGIGSQEIVQSRVGDALDRFTGIVLGAEGQVTHKRLWVRVRYAQGRVTERQGDGPGTPRDLVEGEALFGVRALPWLTVWAGPNARAYSIEEEDQRWLFWTVGGSARASLLPDRLQTFVELWTALSANVTNPATHAAGRGAEAGLEMRFSAAAPIWARFAYRIDSGQAADMRETVEAVALTVIYGLPQ